MSDPDWLAEQFEAHRNHLRAVAYRMLGSATDADDAVQESWIRLSRSDTSEVENLGGWLTTVVARASLDMLRSRASRREEALGDCLSDEVPSGESRIDPEAEAMLADSVGPALLVALETLGPAERLAFVLHDLFGVPFDEIGPIIGRSPTAARQLASRARRRVQGVRPEPDTDRTRQREIVDAFLTASRGGDFQALLALLDPEVVLRGDDAAAASGAPALVLGATAVANTFSGRARAARLALVDGRAGAVWSQGGTPRVVFDFTVVGGKIVGIDMLADPAHVGDLDLTILDR